MKEWIPYPLILLGRGDVELMSLDHNHFDELLAIARDKRIWEHYVYDGSDPETLKNVLLTAMAEREKGNQFPFVIYHKKAQKIIGSTRFLDIEPKHRKLEIGSTWVDPRYWGTSVNLECKLLLLTHCFEVLKTVRVQLKTDVHNIRSRKAIEKIGGQFEGIIRNDMIRDNNTQRDSACYSIISNEWAVVHKNLTERLLEMNKLIS